MHSGVGVVQWVLTPPLPGWWANRAEFTVKILKIKYSIQHIGRYMKYDYVENETTIF